MADCINEITGVQIISLYPSDSVRLVRPDISKENEVNLISDGEDSYIISDPVLLPKWERVVGYSRNYKQNYSDEFTFLAFGIENEIPAIIKELRNTRVGYVVEILTTGNSNYIFQSPVFLNNANTKQIDSHSWQVSLSYRIPSFLDKLINLETILGTASEVLPCDKEIQGVQSISLYVNENIDYNYPDLSNENEVDVIVLEDAFLVVDQVKELPKWERIINYSENYNQNYNDEFTFLLHGIENDVPETIKTLRNNRLGYIAVIKTTSNQNYIFPTPVFLNENNTKQVDSHSWAVSLAYRIPSFENRLTLLSISLIDTLSFKLTINTALGTGTNDFQLPLPNETMNFMVDKGNGDAPIHITSYNQAETLLNYSVGGIYQISITGKCGGWSFNNLGDKLKVTSVDNWGAVAFDSLAVAFFGCSNLSTLPVGSISGTASVTTINSMFRNCSNLIVIPANIFDNIINVTDAQLIFSGASSLTTIPTDLFRENVLINTFSNAFFGCGNLSAIPTDLFRYNTEVTAFTACFFGCGDLTSIPVDLFRYNTLVTTFSNTFITCASITSIPVDLFRYNTLVDNFNSAFSDCISLTSIPNNLFFYNALVTNYRNVFKNCRNMVLPATIFDTANLSIVTNFNDFMSATGSGFSNTGTIQDIWTFALSATSSNAFLNQTALSNYASIPNDWKGL